MSRFWELYGRLAGKAALFFLVFSALAVIIHYIPGLNEEALALYVRGKGALGVAVYILIAAAGSAVGIPRQGLSFVAGYAFGAFWGVVYATAGTTLGCAMSFFISRRFGKPYVPARVIRRMKRFDDFVSAAPFSMTLTVRCLPVGNNALTNVLAGISSIPAAGFIGGSFFGYIPQNFIFSLLGSGMRVDPLWRVLTAAGLFALAFGLGVFLFRRHKASFILDEKRERDEK